MEKDWNYRPNCGCVVTFFAESNYLTSRLLPGEGCDRHVGRHNFEARDALMDRAKRELRKALTEAGGNGRVAEHGWSV